jgi:hypothetical protein
MSQGGKNIHLWGIEATGNYFDVLGVRAFMGRIFTPEDDQRSSPHAVIVLSYTTWLNRFGADPNIVGKSAKLIGLDYNIIGVLPKGFFGTEILLSPEFWVPMSMEPQIEPDNSWLDRRATRDIWVLGRLKPGVAPRQAEADLNAIAADLGRVHNEDEGLHLSLVPPGLFGAFLRGPVLGFASVLVAVAGLVLLIACVNIAGMLLARAAERRREVSICLAIGASRGKLIGQLLTESLLLSAGGRGRRHVDRRLDSQSARRYPSADGSPRHDRPALRFQRISCQRPYLRIDDSFFRTRPRPSTPCASTWSRP